MKYLTVLLISVIIIQASSLKMTDQVVAASENSDYLLQIVSIIAMLFAFILYRWYILKSSESQMDKIQKHMRFAMLVLEQVHDSIIITDTKGYVTFWNEGATKIFGYTADEMIGKHISILTPKEYLEKTKAAIGEVLEKGSFSGEVYRLRKDGSRIFVSLRLSLVRNEFGEPTNIIGFSQDLTEKKKAEEQLKKQQEILYYRAMFDSLTQLPNRALLKDRLKQAIESAKRSAKVLGVMFIDLDNFKIINDSFGHSIGDEVLKLVAQRLKSSLREEDTIARIGGDEFIVVLQNLSESHDAAKIARKIIEGFKEPFVIDHNTFYITCSIGISLYPHDSTDDEELIKFADTAMYKAKENGKNTFEFYSSEMTAFAFERVVMEVSMRQGIQKREFVVHYQPQIDIRHNRIKGLEALIRWQHPTMGLISPANFIPVAEASGLIVELDRYVMKQAVKDIVLWKQKGIDVGRVFLNLSMKQLQQDDFIEFLEECITQVGSSDLFGFEITESEIMKDPQRSIKTLQKLKELGIMLAVDDFGTGYSSLAYLKRFPIDELKIDRSFIVEVPQNEDDVAIVKMIIALARTLHLKVVAEGIETKRQLEFLHSNECDAIQGYYFAKPMNAKEIVEYYDTDQLSQIIKA